MYILYMYILYIIYKTLVHVFIFWGVIIIVRILLFKIGWGRAYIWENLLFVFFWGGRLIIGILRYLWQSHMCRSPWNTLELIALSSQDNRANLFVNRTTHWFLKIWNLGADYMRRVGPVNRTSCSLRLHGAIIFQNTFC